MLLSRYVKGIPFFNGRYTKGVPFLSKIVYKRVRGWTSRRSLPVQKFVECPPGGLERLNSTALNYSIIELALEIIDTLD